MVKKLFMLFCLLPLAGYSQENFDGYQGILRAQGTLCAGFNPAFKSTNIYLHGDLEYYLNNKISIRGDVFYFLNSKTANDPIEPFAYKHELFSGVNYHFTSGKLDLFAGLQPGLIFAKRQYLQFQDSISPIMPLPDPQKSLGVATSVVAGLNYYASRFFHLFIQTRYQYGWLSDNYTMASTSEFKISFGLGFYLRTQKNK